MLKDIKILDAVIHGSFGTTVGERAAWDRIKKVLEELAQQTTNTVSPKFPSKSDWDFFRAGLDNVWLSDGDAIYEWFAEKLRAGA